MVLECAGKSVLLNEQGFMLDWQAWEEAIALALAQREGLELTAAHWEILHFMRAYYQRYKHLPNSRVFVKAVQGSLGAEKGCSRYLQGLFPAGPLKTVCKLAGLPKPPTCL